MKTNGTIFGYLLNGFYLPRDKVKFLTHERLKQSENKFIKKGNKNLVDMINLSNYKVILKDLGVPPNRVVFIPCSKYDIQDEGLSQIWRNLDNTKNLYCCIDTIKDECIGYLMSSSNLYNTSIFYINMLEVPIKGHGNGTLIVNQLKDLGLKLSGLSLTTAYGFWKKQNATFLGCNYFFI